MTAGRLLPAASLLHFIPVEQGLRHFGICLFFRHGILLHFIPVEQGLRQSNFILSGCSVVALHFIPVEQGLSEQTIRVKRLQWRLTDCQDEKRFGI